MDMTLHDYLAQYGYGYDTVIPEELFEAQKDRLHETQWTLPKDGPTYRDDRKRHSVHLTDCRNVDRGEQLEQAVVGHLEYFNPEHHPILHAFVDYPLWWWKNRIKEYNTC